MDLTIAKDFFKPINEKSKRKSEYVYWKRPSQLEFEIYKVDEFEEGTLEKWLETDRMFYAYKK